MAPPNASAETGTETVHEQKTTKHKNVQLQNSYRTLWGRVGAPVRYDLLTIFTCYHIGAVITVFTIPWLEKIKTVAWMLLLAFLAVLGVTAGAHRLWSHRSFKANLPLKVLLVCFYHLSGQCNLYNWVRTHHIHHKYADTDADPHNIKRGFFYAHVGWFIMDKSSEYLEMANKHDYGGCLDDPLLIFCKKHYWPLTMAFLYIIPLGVPMYFWGETLYWAVMTNCMRVVIGIHPVLSINSFAHMFGDRPYDKKQQASQNLFVSVICHGEGWHNYHHAFPWDYRAAEFGKYGINFTARFIELFSKIGWAYDLRSPSRELVKRYVVEKGDGSHYVWGKNKVTDPEQMQKLKL